MKQNKKICSEDKNQLKCVNNWPGACLSLFNKQVSYKFLIGFIFNTYILLAVSPCVYSFAQAAAAAQAGASVIQIFVGRLRVIFLPPWNTDQKAFNFILLISFDLADIHNYASGLGSQSLW